MEEILNPGLSDAGEVKHLVLAPHPPLLLATRSMPPGRRGEELPMKSPHLGIKWPRWSY